MTISEPLLAVEALTVRFGGVTALESVSFGVARGAIQGLIGPNGAGKTTCFNCITRLSRPASGVIAFDGVDLLARPSHRIASCGIARTFQNVALFDHMSVLENVLVGTTCRRLDETHARRAACEALEYLGLASAVSARVRSLPYGARKSVELARALAARPNLLLLDEPAAGLDRDAVAAFGATIRRIRDDFETTIVMVEHDMRLVMDICDRIVVLDSGRTIADGSPTAIRSDPAVTAAYLGAA